MKDYFKPIYQLWQHIKYDFRRFSPQTQMALFINQASIPPKKGERWHQICFGHMMVCLGLSVNYCFTIMHHKHANHCTIFASFVRRLNYLDVKLQQYNIELVRQTESGGPNKQKTEGPNSYLTPNISIEVLIFVS